MIVIRGLSPNASYLRLLSLATQQEWPLEASRVGPCRDLGAVTVELDGGERTLFLSGRGWNPAFALVEAAWVLAGRNDVKSLTEFISNFFQFSDDGQTLHGAYGYRLRHYFGRDQIDAAVDELKANPESRRVVMSLFAPDDLGLHSRDIPCNTHVALRRVRGRLEMTVSNRSNDLWLGVPYNWFVFRALQCAIADRLDIACGIQRHISSCLHLYEKDVAAANRVVCINREADLDREESELTGLDVDGLLRDANALADHSFDSLTSKQLTDFFVRFRSYRGSCTAEESTAPRSVLAVSLDRWKLEHHLTKAITVTKALTYNPETETGLQVQRWAFATPVNTAVARLAVVAREAMPLLLDALRSELGQGIQVKFQDAASENQAAMHFVLELIFGTLDPELVRTTTGDQLRERLAAIANAACLPPTPFRVRELSEERLKYLFGALIS
jgi:thymidylate synthase